MSSRGPRRLPETMRLVPVLALFWASALGAQETPDPNADIAAETARIAALAALEKARNERLAQAVAPLTGLAGEGKVELGDKAGEMEAWLLTSDTIGAAGALIAGQVDDGKDHKIIVLAGDEALDFTPLFAARFRIEDTRKTLSAALQAAPSCTPSAETASPPPAAARFPIAAAIGALGSVLQSDVSVTGVEVDASARLLATSVARGVGGNAVLPAALTLPDKSGSTLEDDLSQLEGVRAQVAARQVCLAAGNAAQKSAATALATALERYAGLSTALNTAADGKDAPIITALKLDWLAQGRPWVLRVDVDKSGGTLLTRKNLWTALGASAVGVTGGLVASYTMVDPNSGGVKAAGIVVCRTRLASIRAVQRDSALPTSSPCRLVAQ